MEGNIYKVERKIGSIYSRRNSLSQSRKSSVSNSTKMTENIGTQTLYNKK